MDYQQYMKKYTFDELLKIKKEMEKNNNMGHEYNDVVEALAMKFELIHG